MFTPNGYAEIEAAVSQIMKARRFPSLDMAANFLRQAFYSTSYSCFYVDSHTGDWELVPPQVFAFEESLEFFGLSVNSDLHGKSADQLSEIAEAPVRSDINLYAGGKTWVDREYDERLGPALERTDQSKTLLNYICSQQLLMSKEEIEELCRKESSDLPIRHIISKTSLRIAYNEYVKQCGNKLPGRDPTLEWAKRTFGNVLSPTMVLEIYEEHAALHPRKSGRPSSKPFHRKPV